MRIIYRMCLTIICFLTILRDAHMVLEKKFSNLSACFFEWIIKTKYYYQRIVSKI